MGGIDVEGEARSIYRSAGLDLDDLASEAELARGLGLEVRAVDARHVRGHAALVEAHGRAAILVRRRLSRADARFAVCHELAEHVLDAAGYQGEDVEEVADRLAAALACPRTAFARAVRILGPEAVHELAEGFLVSPTCAALRVGEVYAAPVAVCTPERVRVRGELWAWGAENDVRQLASEPRPGLARVELEAPRRVALFS